jgi:uncharacterized protein YhaN
MGLFRRATPLDPAEVERLKTDLATLRAALDRHDASSTAMRARLTALDDRVTSVSTELANQLTELGHDIDALNARPAPNGVDPEAIATVREGQVKLANEQARYQIAFREDLARLAQELKRAR